MNKVLHSFKIDLKRKGLFCIKCGIENGILKSCSYDPSKKSGNDYVVKGSMTGRLK